MSARREERLDDRGWREAGEVQDIHKGLKKECSYR